MASDEAEQAGPGELTTDDVGVLSVAQTIVLSARYTMAYAAGINESTPGYYDDLREGGALIHPGIVFSLQWASRARPDQAVNWRAAPYGVHASTDLRIHRPFRPGEAITTQGRVVEKKQLKPGVFVLDRYRMTSSNGEVVAELDYNGITRGATLDGPAVSIEAEHEAEYDAPSFGAVADEPIWCEEIPVAPQAAQQYTECAQIYNPIHTEPSVAKAAGLPDIILHGSATKAMSLSAVIAHAFDGDPARVTRLMGQLRAMVLMNTVMRVEALAEEIVGDEKRILFRTLNEAGDTAIANGIVCGKA